jgi:hypothetical protein
MCRMGWIFSRADDEDMELPLHDAHPSAACHTLWGSIYMRVRWLAVWIWASPEVPDGLDLPPGSGGRNRNFRRAGSRGFPPGVVGDMGGKA